MVYSGAYNREEANKELAAYHLRTMEMHQKALDFYMAKNMKKQVKAFAALVEASRRLHQEANERLADIIEETEYAGD